MNEQTINGMSAIRNEVVNFMEHNENFEKLEGEKWYAVEDALTNWLEKDFSIRWAVFKNVEREYHKEDVMTEIAQRNEYRDEDEKEIKLDEDDIEYVVDKYEDYLEDNDGWHYCLNEALDSVLDD